ncbi:MAG: rhodanese-like domain-containing protein [Firmicutes bacterium]|nr:rhodanese-like domain-containing protein [Bacillota bacterium]
MKKTLLISILLFSVLLITSCVPAAGPVETVTEEPVMAVYSKINATEAKEMIDSVDVIILDVRTLEEYEEIRIEGALLIPEDQIRTLAPEMLPDKEAIILIYCRSGRRSEIAARELIDMGYRYVYDFGGIIDWPYETVSGK